MVDSSGLFGYYDQHNIFLELQWNFGLCIGSPSPVEGSQLFHWFAVVVVVVIGVAIIADGAIIAYFVYS